MSNDYDNTNTGALWRNEDATDQNKQPTHTGNLNVEGKEFKLAAWLKPAQDGKKARLNLKIQEPQPKEVEATDNSSTPVTDGDIPF